MEACSKYGFVVSSEYEDAKFYELSKGAIFSGLTEKTSSHGIPQVHVARGSVKKIIWAGASVVALALLLWYMSNIFLLFFSWPVDVKVEMLAHRELEFPAVTICNMNPIKKSALQGSAALQSSFSRRRKRDIPNNLDPSFQTHKTHNVKAVTKSERNSSKTLHRHKRSISISSCSNSSISYDSQTGICYGLFDTAVREYSKTRGKCEDEGAIAVINSQRNLDFLTARSSSIFSGISDPDVQGYWIYNKKLEWAQKIPTTWSNWKTGQPASSSECGIGRLGPTDLHKWETVDCDNEDNYISLCQKYIGCPNALYTFGGTTHCYFLFGPDAAQDNFDHARDACEKIHPGADLAELDSEAKVNHVMSLNLFAGVNNNFTRYWINLRVSGSQWEWRSDSRPLTWSNWETGQGSDKRSGADINTHKWYSFTGDSDSDQLVLCEIKGLTVEATPLPLNVPTTEDPPTTATSITTTEPTTTAKPTTTVEPTTSVEPTTTDEPTTTVEQTTPEPTTTVEPTTTSEPTTTVEPTTTTEPTTTVEPTTSVEPTTTEPTTTVEQRTTEPTTTVEPTTTTEPTTTVEPTTTSEPTTTVEPKTTAEPTTTIEPTTTTEPTTSTEPTTTAESSTAIKPTTMAEPTTSIEPTTTAEPTTTIEPITTAESSTTIEPITTAESSTTIEPTTTAEPTTSVDQATTVKSSTTAELTVDLTSFQPITTVKPTSIKQTTIEESTLTTVPTTRSTSSAPSLKPTMPSTASPVQQITPAPVAVVPTIPPLVGSKYPERVQYRQEFQQQEQITETVANLPEEEKAALGYKANEFLLDCQYFGYPCDPEKDFASFYNAIHGNCFIFNSKWSKFNKRFKSYKTGRRYGLKVTVNIGQDDYTDILGESAGVRFVVHPQHKMPFPEDEGYLAKPGKLTSVGLKKVVIERKGGWFGTCVDMTTENYTRNIYEEVYDKVIDYSMMACYKTCYQRSVIDTCGCADSYYPKYGAAFDYRDVRTCDTSNIEEDDCKYGVNLKYINDELECDCPTPCVDELYIPSISTSRWPSDVQKNVTLMRLGDSVSQLMNDPNDTTKFERNVLLLEVYFEEFNYERIFERQKYMDTSFISDIGGILGLFLGFTIMTVVEFLEFITDYIVLAILWLKHRDIWRTYDKSGSREKIIPSVSDTDNLDDHKRNLNKEYHRESIDGKAFTSWAAPTWHGGHEAIFKNAFFGKKKFKRAAISRIPSASSSSVHGSEIYVEDLDDVSEDESGNEQSVGYRNIEGVNDSMHLQVYSDSQLRRYSSPSVENNKRLDLV